MKIFLDKILDQILKNGLAITLLSVATYVYWTQNQKLHTKIEGCNQQIIDIYKEQNERMIESLDKNTEVMENLSILLRNQ